MTRFIPHMVILLSLAPLQLASRAEAATVVTWGGADNFNSAQFTFPEFTANALTSYAGTGFYQDGGANLIFSVELRLNGVWTVLGSSEPSNGLFNHEIFDDIEGGDFFATALVTGIGFLVSDPPPVGYAFNDMTRTQFTFDTLDVAETPLPAALPLFGTGLGAMGLFGWWRRRRAAAL